MKFDWSELNELDFENMGAWPPLAKGVFVGFVAIVVMVLTYLAIVSDKIVRYESEVAKEAELTQQFQTKYHAAARLDLYKAQMAEAEEQFSLLLKRLPSRHETPGLLDDITYVGTTSGLTFRAINWEPEVQQQYYVELPINIEVIGQYHDFGDFVSKVAALPRIVTVHDFTISSLPRDKGEQLVLKLQAKTYRYKHEEGGK